MSSSLATGLLGDEEAWLGHGQCRRGIEYAAVVEARERENEFEYHVSLSFAGEQRGYVAQVAAALERDGVRVFYDGYEQVNLWGKNLYEHLDHVYRRAARYCVFFISQEYAAKVWTTHERRSAQARALQESHEYILPARFDETEVPGLLPTVSYIDLRPLQPEEFARILLEKLGFKEREPAAKIELRRACREASEAIHRFLTERNREDPSRQQVMVDLPRDAPEAERNRVWHEWNEAIIRFYGETMSLYRERFMVQTLALYDESVRQGIVLRTSRERFEHPTNLFGIADVANTLGTVGASAV